MPKRKISMISGLTSEKAKKLWLKWKKENPQWLIERNKKISLYRRKLNLIKNPMKNSEIVKKRQQTFERLNHYKKLSKTLKNRKFSKKSIEKMRQVKLINPINYWLGKHRYKTTNEKISKKLKGKHTSFKTEFKKGKFSGNKHFNWKGGISFEPYTPEFNEQLKERVRFRDSYACQLCGLKQNGCKLSIHHIDYNKKNNGLNNLITLCTSCNFKVNYDRIYWKNYFINKIKGDEKSWVREKVDLENIVSFQTKIYQ
jgi:hypothetical protein